MHININNRTLSSGPDLESLLNNIGLEVLHEAVHGLLGDDARLVDTTGNPIVGQPSAITPTQRYPICIELKPIAYLETNIPEQTDAVGKLLQ